MYFFIKLGRHVNHDERMDLSILEVKGQGHNGHIYGPINFGGQRSKVKVTMDIYGDKPNEACEHERY